MNIPKNREKHWEKVRNQLWRHMQENPITLKEIMRDTKMSHPTLENFLYGDHTPEIPTVCRVMKYLEEKCPHLLTSEDDE